MIKFIALFAILAVAVNAYPAVKEAGVQAPKALPTDGQADLATKNLEEDLDSGNESDLKGSETFGFAYYPVYHYGQGYGWGGYGGWGNGGWGNGGWGYPTQYYYYW